MPRYSRLDATSSRYTASHENFPYPMNNELISIISERNSSEPRTC